MEIMCQKNEELQKNLIDFLKENTIYESLALNSQVIVLDKHFSCYDTIYILQDNDSEDIVLWNSEISDFDGLITYTDVIDIILSFFKNIILNINNNEIFEEKTKHISLKMKSYNSDHSSQQDDNEMEIEDDDDSLNIKRVTEDQIGIQTPISQTEQQMLQKMNQQITQTQKQKLIQDIKKISIKSWLQKCHDEIFKTQEIISIDENRNLLEAYQKMRENNLHRIIVIDKECNIIVSTLTQKDILLFIIKNLRFKQGDVQINYYNEQFDCSLLTTKKIITMEKSQTVYQIFKTMINHQISSVPIVDQDKKYLGVINKKDIVFILRENKYELLSEQCQQFLNFVQQEKKCYNSTANEGTQMFQEGDSVIQVVHKLLFAPQNRLIRLDSNQNIITIITLTDLFQYLIGKNK